MLRLNLRSERLDQYSFRAEQNAQLTDQAAACINRKLIAQAQDLAPAYMEEDR